MSPVKHDDVRPAQRWSKPGRAPASRRGRENWLVRWIGAAKFRTARAVAKTAIEAPSARIIELGWTETLGRPVRTGPAGILRPAGTIAPLLPLLR